jgi:hypothetical protein
MPTLFAHSAAIPLLIGLFLFGVLYALAVYKMGDCHRGYTSLLVVIGVAVTVASSFQIIGWNDVLWIFLAFVATGTPMIAGDIFKALRERQKRDHEQYQLLQRLAERGIGEASEVNDAETETAGQ